MKFTYNGLDSNYRKVTMELEADSLEDAKNYLRLHNIIYSNIKQSNKQMSFSFFDAKLTKKDLSTLSRDLGFYMKSGVTIGVALKLAQSQYSDNKKIGEFLFSVSKLVNEGQTFADALIKQKMIKLPQFYVQSVKASQDGGILDIVLMELSEYIASQEKIEKKITNAMAYPAFIIVSAIIMVGFMLSYVVPKVVGIFSANRQELPAITKYVLASSDFVSNNYLLITIVAITITVVVKFLNNTNEEFKSKFDLFALKIPLIGKIILVSQLSRFSYMSSLLLKSGMTLVQALKLSSNLLSNTVISDIFVRTSSNVVEGSKLSNSIIKQDYKQLIPLSFTQSLSLGEETGMLEDILSSQAQRYNEENDNKISFMLSLLEPMMMLIVGGVIAVIVLGMMLPIFSMNIGAM
jgi:general secretion pathway protein F/type IV pilus assembly protein PilC